MKVPSTWKEQENMILCLFAKAMQPWPGTYLALILLNKSAEVQAFRACLKVPFVVDAAR